MAQAPLEAFWVIEALDVVVQRCAKGGTAGPRLGGMDPGGSLLRVTKNDLTAAFACQ